MKLDKVYFGITLAVTLASILTLSHPVVAQTESQPNEIEVAYKTFYSHTRKLAGDDISALRFAFGFSNIHTTPSLCHIENAYIHTQKVDIPLLVSPEQRFSIPTEKALRLADAKVVLALTEQPNHCDINVQIETLPEYLKLSYTQDEIKFILSQYMAFFDEMGGFMSFMMPQVSGLQLRFADEGLNVELNNGLSIVQGILRLSSNEIVNIKDLTLPQAPLRITALTESK